jgi:aspartate/methionine/tyrosine aminotransferase
LSVNTPVQQALPGLFDAAQDVRRQIRARIQHNYHVLQQLVSHVPSCQLLRAEGGWSAVMRVPHTMPEDQRVIQLLEEDRVLVHPGYFFDFPRDGYLIVSLLPRPDAFRSAVERVLDALSHA